MREVVQPLGDQVGLDYYEWYCSAPTTDPALAIGAAYCGLSLLMAFTYEDGWQAFAEGLDVGKSLPKKAARNFRAALPTQNGRAAVSWMAQGYLRSMATFWIRAAGTPDHRDDARSLTLSATRATELADLVHRFWPVTGYEGVLSQVAHAAESRLFDPDNPNAMVDLRAYADRAQETAEAAACAAGPHDRPGLWRSRSSTATTSLRASSSRP